MTFLPTFSRRAKLMAWIAEQDRLRGRPLSDSEKLRNLYDSLSRHDSDCVSRFKGGHWPCSCGASRFAKKFRRP